MVNEQGTRMVVNQSFRPALDVAFDHALRFLDGLPERRVFPETPYAELLTSLDMDIGADALDPAQVITELAEAAGRGIVASAGGRYFGFVIGGSVPAALAADWLTAAWDQNAAGFAASPFASAIEEVTIPWLIELLGLPSHVSCGFVTDGQMANVTGLAAARHHVLAQAGWNVECQGLACAPEISVLVGAERHLSIDQALRFLGIGTDAIVEVDVDRQGRMDPTALREALAGWKGPAIVCAQAGNINSGAVDPIAAICDVAAGSGAWVHVDGAIGLWAVTSERYRPLLRGFERADSWATDAHKWLNVPYDSGLIFCAHPESHKAAMSIDAPYIVRGAERSGADWTPEWSRRARAVPVYAAIRSLGQAGIAGIVERCCAHAQRFAEALSAAEGVEVLNDVVLNQVVVRFPDPDGNHDARTRAVIANVQNDGTCWLGGTVWQGRAAMRISVTNWSTCDDDVDRSIDAILRAAALA